MKQIAVLFCLLFSSFAFSQSITFTKVYLKDLKPGARFIAAAPLDKAIEDYETIKLAPYKSKAYISEMPLKNYANKIFEFKRIETRKGEAYIVFSCEGKEYEKNDYALSVSDTNISKRAEVSGLVYLEDYYKAKEKIAAGWNAYTLQESWDDYQSTIYYQKVRIIDIQIDNSILGGPYKIIFETDDGKRGSLRSTLSGTNRIVADTPIEYLFSETDPRAKHPDISDEIWKVIQKGSVRIGMTKKEAELSWGKPKKINTTLTATGKSEQWVYDLNRYLYFDNGKLTAAQN